MPVWWCTGPGIFMVGRTARSGSEATPLLDLLVWVVGDVVKAEDSNKKQKGWYSHMIEGVQASTLLQKQNLLYLCWIYAAAILDKQGFFICDFTTWFGMSITLVRPRSLMNLLVSLLWYGKLDTWDCGRQTLSHSLELQRVPRRFGVQVSVDMTQMKLWKAWV